MCEHFGVSGTVPVAEAVVAFDEKLDMVMVEKASDALRQWTESHCGEECPGFLKEPYCSERRRRKKPEAGGCISPVGELRSDIRKSPESGKGELLIDWYRNISRAERTAGVSG